MNTLVWNFLHSIKLKQSQLYYHLRNRAGLIKWFHITLYLYKISSKVIIRMTKTINKEKKKTKVNGLFLNLTQSDDFNHNTP